MAHFHTLVIPTRNRPEYLAVPVGTYLSSPRDDIECVVCDGSDYPDMVRQVLAPWMSDHRLQVIDNTTQTMGIISSMPANWSRALDAVRGGWVTVVGDDDVLDPALLDFLILMEQKIPSAQVLAWPSIQFDIGVYGADGKPRLMPARIPMGWQTLGIDPEATLKQELTWPRDKGTPAIVLSVYHGAVRRELLESVREEREGNWFRFGCVDYDLGWTLAARLKQAVRTMRPFSVNGHSPKSNSWSIGKHTARKERAEQWLQENNNQLDGWSRASIEPYLRAGLDPIFFHTLPIALYGVRQAFVEAMGLGAVPFIRENFVKTLVWDAQGQADEYSYDWYIKQLNLFLPLWLNQKVDLSAVHWLGGVREPVFVGLQGDTLLFDRRLVEGDLERFSTLVFRMIPPPALIL